MERQAVASSNLRSVGYDAESAILEIQFHHGGVYQYVAVPLTIYEGLMAAGSKGRYFASHIKKRYRYRKVR
ncbi:MAG: KTSC domain-containing protein [Nitrosomonas ureae]